MMGRNDVITLQRQCCSQICQSGVAVAEYAIRQLPVHMAPALLVAAVSTQQHDVASCIVSSWPLPILRYTHAYIVLSAANLYFFVDNRWTTMEGQRKKSSVYICNARVVECFGSICGKTVQMNIEH